MTALRETLWSVRERQGLNLLPCLLSTTLCFYLETSWESSDFTTVVAKAILQVLRFIEQLSRVTEAG